MRRALALVEPARSAALAPPPPVNYERECDNLRCGKRYIAHRLNSRFCSDACRVYSHQHKTRREPAAVQAPPAAVQAPGAAAQPLATRPGPGPDEPGSVVAAVEKELSDAGRAGTVPGQLARVLAMRLDNSRGESGAGLSSLAKHVEALMASALKGAPTAPDALDELERRRQEKLAEANAS